MPNHPALLATTAAVLAIGAPTAMAAEVSVDRSCYADASQRKDTVAFSGSGFNAGAPFTITLDGKPVAGGTGTVDAAGDVSGSFIAPKLKTVSKNTHEHTFHLKLSDGSNQPETLFTVAKLFADFTPSKGNPKTLKVVFNLFGFGLTGEPAPPIYVHYVRPDGKVQKTRLLGHGRGNCGSRKKTAKQPLFGFSAVRGSWKLQFDTSKTYKHGTAGADFLYYVVPVSVRKS
jgi:hypothetical protein